jgi:tetratricopeptide (TPR) repeat protein
MKRNLLSLCIGLVAGTLASLALTCARPRSGAWERWGITRPAPDAAEPRLVAACTLLYATKFDSARQVYADLVRDYPNSAEAHLGLSMAYRYLEQRDTALAEAKTALALDPEGTGPLCQYAKLLLVRLGTTEKPGDSARTAGAIEAARKATATRHRYSTSAHVTLWTHYVAAGRLAEARQEMKVLGEKGYYPPILMDFGRNMLTGLPPDAILFTGGDTDTEPLLCLQATEELRPDITVVKLSFLMFPKTIATIRDSLRLPLSFSDQELQEILSQPDFAGGKPGVRFARIRDNIIANAHKQNRPVYFASTVDAGLMGDWKGHLVREGIFSHVVPARTDDSIDVPKVLENVESWRVATAGRKVDWPACMAPNLRQISWLNLHYISVYLDLARHFQSQGDTAQVDEWCRRSYGLIEHLEDPQRAGHVVRAWLDLNPSSAEAKELSKKYD